MCGVVLVSLLLEKKDTLKDQSNSDVSIVSDAAVDSPSSVIPPSHINALFSFGVERQFSRYFNEFEELQLLGKGAFGAVIKVGSFLTR